MKVIIKSLPGSDTKIFTSYQYPFVPEKGDEIIGHNNKPFFKFTGVVSNRSYHIGRAVTIYLTNICQIGEQE